ncbi:hypothetical protein TSOC_007974 [Tetrabaena socialis]|uniref:Uncharacterized protein n=1 Tax=Tetrabaena socialis TaxID=47790 RepID=A0A2J7ZZP4_9CHLO|nr:hypothetical protein TSOC_007974 [Tetrabaena socialis]|eukprot:PNH05744.1 hypothetical protein TSOC_007974 [Tetrabaena socialis]
MAYFGFQTTGNFVAWMVIAVCFVTGCIWLPIGGVGLGGCAFCRDQYKWLPTVDAPVETWYPDVDKNCVALLFSFQLWEPILASGRDAKDEYYSFCVNSGPMAAMIAGGVVLLVSFFTLTFFCCARRPSAVAPTAVVMDSEPLKA